MTFGFFSNKNADRDDIMGAINLAKFNKLKTDYVIF
jgi:hypothetical protein